MVLVQYSDNDYANVDKIDSIHLGERPHFFIGEAKIMINPKHLDKFINHLGAVNDNTACKISKAI